MSAPARKSVTALDPSARHAAVDAIARVGGIEPFARLARVSETSIERALAGRALVSAIRAAIERATQEAPSHG